MIWDDLKGYEGIYLISNKGHVFSCKKNRECSGSVHVTGYIKLTLTKDGVRSTKYLHRLVAEQFVPNPENKKQVSHIDGNKLNNRADNLKWVTESENVANSYRHMGSNFRRCSTNELG